MRITIIVSIVLCVFGSTAVAQEAKQVVGWMENAKIMPENVLLPARLDTGADSTSLEAEGVAEFVKDGKKWVRFVAIQPDGTRSTFQREVIRSGKAKQVEGAAQEPIVKLGICLGNQFAEVEVTLVDRGRFKHPLLVGRNYLVGRLVVDPSEEFTAEPECMDGIRSGQRDGMPYRSALYAIPE